MKMKIFDLAVLMLSTVLAASINQDQKGGLNLSSEKANANTSYPKPNISTGTTSDASQSKTSKQEPIEFDPESLDPALLDSDYWSRFITRADHSPEHEELDESDNSELDEPKDDLKDDTQQSQHDNNPRLVRRYLKSLKHEWSHRYPLKSDPYMEADYHAESLLNISRRAISPRPGLLPVYFNLSEFRSYKPADDIAHGWNGLDTTNDRDSWLHPHTQAHCILGGIGKRPIQWQPKIVRDFFETPFKRRGITGDYKNNRIPNLLNFWSKDPATAKWRSFSTYIALKHVGSGEGLYDFSETSRQPVHGKQEQCRRACQTCYRAAKDTGAEQFICLNKNRFVLHRRYCQMAMVMGDPIGNDQACLRQGEGGPNRFPGKQVSCGQLRLAQPGTPRNIYPPISCWDILPCKGSKCLVENNTMIVAVGHFCRLGKWEELDALAGKVKAGVSTPLWGVLGFQNLSSAMQDKSVRVYYTDITTRPGTREKAILIGTEFARANWRHPSSLRWRVAFGAADRQTKPWHRWNEDDPIPKEWMELHYFNEKYAKSVYIGGVAFGTIAGGTYLNASDPIEIQHWR